MKRRGIPAVLYYLLTAVMCITFCTGVYSFFTVPAQAKEEAEEIERMLRQRQEEAEERRRIAMEEARKRREEEQRLAEEAARYPLKQRYSDASEMYIVGIGDSVMLSALPQLYNTFPNGYFDAVFGRTIYEGKVVTQQLAAQDALGDAVIFSLGANSYIEESDVEELIGMCGDRPTFWMSTYGVSNDSTQKMQNVVARHENAFMIDWGSYAYPHASQWILADGLHPNAVGSEAYAGLIREVINEQALNKKPEEKEE